MKPISTLLILVISIICSGQGTSKMKYDIAYQSDKSIFVLNYLTKKELHFTGGFDPAISPDGFKLAYTKSSGPGTKDFRRYIVVVDLNTNTETELKIANNNYYGASWSPDNKYIAFNIWANPPKWQTGIIKLENSEVKIFDTKSKTGTYQPTWAPDGKSVYAHDGSKIYRYNLKGNLLDSISIKETFGETYHTSSNTKFLFTPDNEHIIFNCSINEFMKNVDGPVEAIFAYNTKTKKIIRISPQKMYASDPEIESDNRIVFTGTKENEKTNNIYRFDLLSNQLNPAIKNGRRPTTSK